MGLNAELHSVPGLQSLIWQAAAAVAKGLGVHEVARKQLHACSCMPSRGASSCLRSKQLCLQQHSCRSAPEVVGGPLRHNGDTQAKGQGDGQDEAVAASEGRQCNDLHIRQTTQQQQQQQEQAWQPTEQSGSWIIYTQLLVRRTLMPLTHTEAKRKEVMPPAKYKQA